MTSPEGSTAETLPFHLRGNYAPVLARGDRASTCPSRARSRATLARPLRAQRPEPEDRRLAALVPRRRHAPRHRARATGGPSGTATAGCARAASWRTRRRASGPTAALDRTVALGQHPRGRPRRPHPRAGRDVVPHRGHARARYRRHASTSAGVSTTRDDRAPEALPAHRRAALLRLLVPAAVPHLPPRRRRGPARAERGHRGAGPDDDPRLRDHRRGTWSSWTCPWCSTSSWRMAGHACRTGGATTTARALGVMPRGGTNADVRWFEVAPVLRLPPAERVRGRATARVVVDVVRYPELWRDGSTAPVDAARAPSLARRSRRRAGARAAARRPRDRVPALRRAHGGAAASLRLRRLHRGRGGPRAPGHVADQVRPARRRRRRDHDFGPGPPARRAGVRAGRAGIRRGRGLGAGLRLRQRARRQRPRHPRRHRLRRQAGRHRSRSPSVCRSASTGAGSPTPTDPPAPRGQAPHGCASA